MLEMHRSRSEKLNFFKHFPWPFNDFNIFRHHKGDEHSEYQSLAAISLLAWVEKQLLANCAKVNQKC